jgi:hypothetical protein
MTVWALGEKGGLFSTTERRKWEAAHPKAKPQRDQSLKAAARLSDQSWGGLVPGPSRSAARAGASVAARPVLAARHPKQQHRQVARPVTMA